MPGARPSVDDVRRGIRIARKLDLDRSDMARAVRIVKKARKWKRRLDRLPGVEIDLKPKDRGVFERAGADFRNDDRLGEISRPRNTWLFSWATKPIQRAVNRALFTPPKSFRRKPGPNERVLYDSRRQDK